MLAQCTEEGLELSEYVQDPLEKEKLTKAVQELQSGWDNVGKRKSQGKRRGRKGKREGGREEDKCKYTKIYPLLVSVSLLSSSSFLFRSIIVRYSSEAN